MSSACSTSPRAPWCWRRRPGLLGAIEDYWFRWVIDIGLPGPDRGEGGKYLILPPGYDGPLPEGGFAVARARTNLRHVVRPVVPGETTIPSRWPTSIRKFTKIYPYEAGGVGTPIAEFLAGKAQLGRITPPPPTVFHEGSGKVMNTIPPNDFSYFEMLNEVVQQEPATSLDPELMGPIAAIGIIKGKPFAPDARMKKILTEALALANATSRSLFMNPRDPSWFYYPGSAWLNLLFVVRLRVRDADPDDHHARASSPSRPPATARWTRARRSSTASPASRRRWPCACPASARSTSSPSLDADKKYFDGAKTYKVTLPKGIPEANFWSFTLYDNQTRSMLDTPQRYPRAGSQSYPVARRRSRTPTAPRRSTSARPSPRASSAATGFRPMPEQGLVHDPAPLQPARTVLHQGVAAERDRAGEVTSRSA